MESRQLKCAFTGHRENKLDPQWSESSAICASLKQQIYDTIENLYESGISYFICGMAHGCDLYFAEAVLKFKENHPDVQLEAAIPYAGQADRWSGPIKKRYDAVLNSCCTQTILQQYYTRDCMMRRNRYMVDNASVLIAVYNGSPGGTRNTILYAMRQGLEIIEIEIEKTALRRSLCLSFILFSSLAKYIAAGAIDGNGEGQIFNSQLLYRLAAQVMKGDLLG